MKLYTPRIYFPKATYAHYADKLLKEHPQWWGKYKFSAKLRNAYIYAKEGNKIVLKMSWDMYREILKSYFNKAKARIIQGETLRLGADLGKLRACRIQRNFNNPVVDWVSTWANKQFDAAGRVIKVYYTNEDYCRIEWVKFEMLCNEKSYEFSPTEVNTTTQKGFKKEFAVALVNDPLLRYKYKYYPLIVKKEKVCAPLV